MDADEGPYLGEVRVHADDERDALEAAQDIVKDHLFLGDPVRLVPRS